MGVKNKETPRKRISGVLLTRKMGREPASLYSLFLCSRTTKTRLLQRLLLIVCSVAVRHLGKYPQGIWITFLCSSCRRNSSLVPWVSLLPWGKRDLSLSRSRGLEGFLSKPSAKLKKRVKSTGKTFVPWQFIFAH